MSTGGLDQLFGERDDPPVAEEAAEPARRSWAAWTVRNLLLIALATTVVVAMLRSADVEISIVFVVAALAGLRLILLAVAEVRAPPAIRRSDRRAAADGTAGTDLPRAAVRRGGENLWRAAAVEVP